MLRNIVFKSALAFIACSVSISAHAYADERRQIDVPAGELTAALRALAQQSGIDLVYGTEQLAGLRTSGATGSFTPEEALRKLIEGTALVLRADSSGAVLIALPRAPTATPDVPETTNAGGQKADEVVVTGSRLKQSENVGSSPVTVFSREKIDEIGATNVADALKYLPQQTTWGGDANRPGGAREVRLRGLGAGTTLVLINGRRVMVSGLGTTQNFFDLNTIPMSAVERIEVLSDSASAVYGADAVGGVVNIVLKSDIKQPSVDLYYGSADGGARERRVSGSLGHSWSRAKVGAVVDFYERGDLLGAEREIYGNADYTRFGGIDRRVTTTNPGNVCSTNGQNLPGLSSPCAAVPVGSTGVGLTAADFQATAGQQRRESLTQYRSLISPSERTGAIAFGDVDLTERITAFTELMFTHLQSRSSLGPEPRTNLLVPAANPFNPFGQAVNVNYAFSNDLDREQFADSKSWRAVAGLKGTLGSWDWEVSGLRFEDEAWQDNTRNSIDTAKLKAALAATDPALAFNPFQDGNGGSDSLLRSLIADPLLSRFYTTSKASQAGAFARGDVFALPAGNVQVVVGAESRTEDLRIRVPGRGYAVDGDRRTWATYSEVRLPIIGVSQSVPVVNQLTATLAGRYDHYSDFGGVFNPKYGLEWNPLHSLLLRASYGTSYRAPILWDLYSPRFVVPGSFLQDPNRNNETAVYTRILGGNPDLQPEEAESFTTGFVYTPDVAGRLRIGGTYWTITQNSRINSLDPLLLLRNESLFPSRIVREAPTAADLAAGLPGRLISVDSTSINFGGLKVKGVDLETSMVLDSSLGLFTPTLAATWIDSYRVQDFPGQAATERVGIAGDSTTGTIPRWRAVASVSWKRGGTELSTTARFVTGYDDVTLNVLNGNHVDSETLVDAQMQLDLARLLGDSLLLSGINVRLGVINLFDREPQYSDTLQQGFDPTAADIRGRFGYLSVTKKF